MKIWLQSSAFLPTPPPSTGGLETVVAGLATAFHQRGHQVTLFALEGSALPGIEVVTSPAANVPFRTEVALVDRMERLPRPDVAVSLSFVRPPAGKPITVEGKTITSAGACRPHCGPYRYEMSPVPAWIEGDALQFGRRRPLFGRPLFGVKFAPNIPQMRLGPMPCVG